MTGAMVSWGLSLLLGGVFSLGIAAGARAAGALTRDGAVAAVVVGTVVFGFGGWPAAALLLTFFATSSLLTRWHADRKLHPEHRRGRGAGQVLANGLAASVLAVWGGVAPSVAVWTAFAAALAASTADTWATEVGMLSPSPPRLITTWRPVARGTSGGVTVQGTIAGIVGAGAVAVLGTLLLAAPPSAVWLAGVSAMLVDSVLGATVEQRVSWVTNDVVNLTMTVLGATLAALLAMR